MRLLLLLAGVFVVFLMITNSSDGPDRSTGETPVSAESTAQEPIIDKSEAMQADRLEFIQKLITNGVIQKVEVPGHLPRAWVRPGFYTLDFDTKESFISVIYSYYFDGTEVGGSVRLYDSLSGNEVGSYSLVKGGLEMFD